MGFVAFWAIALTIFYLYDRLYLTLRSLLIRLSFHNLNFCLCQAMKKFLEFLSADIGEDIAMIQFNQGSFHQTKYREKSRKYYPYFSTPSPSIFNPISSQVELNLKRSSE